MSAAINVTDRILNRIFKDAYSGQQVKRLVQEWPSQKLEGAGWCREAIRDVINEELAKEASKPKGKRGFHVISLKGSEKLRRLHQVLLDAKGKKLSSLELTQRTRLVAISTWLNHLKKPPNNIPVLNEQRTENGQQVWYWWIEK